MSAENEENTDSYPWRCPCGRINTKRGSGVCNLLWTLDWRNKTSHTTKDARCLRMARPFMGGLGRGHEHVPKSLRKPLLSWRAEPITQETNESTETSAEERKQQQGQGQTGQSHRGSRNTRAIQRTWPRRFAKTSRDLLLGLRRTPPSLCSRREVGVDRIFAQGISRSNYDARGYQIVDRESRSGEWAPWYQELTPSDEISRESQEATCRGNGPTPSPQSSLDESPLCWNTDVGKTTGRFPETSGSLTEQAGRARAEITATNRIIQQLSSHAAVAQHHPPPRPARRPRTQWRTLPTRKKKPSGSIGNEKLRKFSWLGPRSSEGNRNPRRGLWQGRRSGQALQKTTFIGALCVQFCEIVNVGRDKEVLSNSLGSPMTLLAACGSWDTSSRFLLPRTNSVLSELRYVSPFQACLNAMNLQWEVGQDLLFESISKAAPCFPQASPCKHLKDPILTVLYRSGVDLRIILMFFLVMRRPWICSAYMLHKQPFVIGIRIKPWRGRRIRKAKAPKSYFHDQAPLSEMAVLSRHGGNEVSVASDNGRAASLAPLSNWAFS